MNPTSKNRYGLAQTAAIWLLVFSSGWFVMLTELVGARVLAPYFGNSIYVWGSVIAIFLLALSIGYALGGKMTQSFASASIPAALAALSGIYVTTTPLYQNSLSSLLYNTGMDVKWGALLAAIVLYGPPMVLLGGVSPYCVQLATRTQLEVGNRAGALYAVSTIGSFLGCLITAFVLIPGLPLSIVTLCGGLGMVAVAAIVALVMANRIAFAGVVGVVSLLALGLVAHNQMGNSWHAEMKAYNYPLKSHTLSSFSPDELGPHLRAAQAEATKEAAKYMSAGPKTLLEMETPYHQLLVLQDGPVRQMTFGKTDVHTAQTVVDLRDLSWHASEYTQLALAGMLYRPAPKRVCVIGVGGAVIPRALELCFPGVEVDVVDIDPTVFKVAQEYFYWRPSNKVKVYAQDGRSFINWVVINRRPLYDWVIIDAYNDDWVPFHLTTQEFAYTVKRVLAPDGVLAANMCIDKDLYAYEARTFKQVFGNVAAYAGHRSGNIILVSQNGRTKPLTIDEAAGAAKKLRLSPETRVDPQYIVSCLMNYQNWSDDGPVLTDLWAPVENLGR